MKIEILDVGCGSRFKGTVNVDLFYEPFQRAGETQSLKTLEIPNFVRADAHQLPFRDETFELVRASHLLEHCLHPYQVLEELKRVSKCLVYIEIPYGDKTPDRCPYHLYTWTLNSFEHLLKLVFPYCYLWATERIAERIAQRKGKLMTISDLLRVIIRKLHYSLVFRTQISALCSVKSLKVVYTVADVGDLIKQAVNSIKSVRKFFEKEDILVYYTEPRSERNKRILEKYATVIESETLTKPFVFRVGSKPQHYGEKVHLCETDADTVIFLDADTKMKKNILPLLIGDYDFSARIGSAYFDTKIWNNQTWIEMFQEIGETPIPMPNTGFMIFKNRFHKQIFKDWLRFINDDLPNPVRGNYLKEQYALALALAKNNAKIKWMTKKEHAFKWEGEFGLSSYVVHGSTHPLRRKIRKWIRKIYSKTRGTKNES